MIYLDYTANMPPEEAVLERFCEVERRCLGNPNARHAAGYAAQKEMADAATRAAAALRVLPEEVIFTSGASESNNTAIQGIAYASRHFGRHMLTTPLEHASVSGCLTALQERGWQIDMLEIAPDGRVDLDSLRDLLRSDTVLVTLCAVDSELGAIQPVAEAARIIRAYPHCRLHVDATQAVGKVAFDFSLADTVSLSGHKFGGLNGSGLLYKKSQVEMEPLIHGGVSTTLYRSGTPAAGLAASLSLALEMARDGQETHYEKVSGLNAMLRRALTDRGAQIYSPGDAVPHILNLGMPGIKGRDFRDALDRHGVCVSVKSACSVENTPSRAVYAVTHNRRQALESWRVSLSHHTTADEIKEFLRVFDAVCKEIML
ncbi:MAG: aminotransferase class V-fold PLP-dependent enzyme [Clostridia bacterium]|nr:aminotransferase class V-fold PLP-dependent enzyme [Clostridia bacterium]